MSRERRKHSPAFKKAKVALEAIPNTKEKAIINQTCQNQRTQLYRVCFRLFED